MTDEQTFAILSRDRKIRELEQELAALKKERGLTDANPDREWVDVNRMLPPWRGDGDYCVLGWDGIEVRQIHVGDHFRQNMHGWQMDYQRIGITHWMHEPKGPEVQP